MTTVRLYDILVDTAVAGIAMQQVDGSMPAGHNGPYNDPETPVRNTSHWLITFLKAWKISGENRFSIAAERAALYLQSTAARPHGYTFHHRDKPGKDSCNGLIGQAWTIEALVTASQAFREPKFAELAESVFSLQPFDEAIGLWRVTEIDGRTLGYDSTFNHQLWYAAAGAMLDDQVVNRQLLQFIDSLSENLDLYPSGIVRHPVAQEVQARVKPGLTVRAKIAVARVIKSSGESKASAGQAMEYKSLGYHAFNLYAFAMLATKFPRHPFWSGETMSTMLKVVDTESFVRGLEDNKYGFPYNPPGFEIAFAMRTFTERFSRDIWPDMMWWGGKQLRRCYDTRTHLMSRDTTDPHTHAARMYEATRLPDMEVSIGSN